jgi:endonuclease YncB( thermonuclease family)
MFCIAICIGKQSLNAAATKPARLWLTILWLVMIPMTDSVFAETLSATVDYVFDGDSFTAIRNGEEIVVRMIGIDAPEGGDRKRNLPDMPFANAARRFLKNRIEGNAVLLKCHGRGGFDRRLCEVFESGVNINLLLLYEGMAEVYRGRLPFGFRDAPYRAAEAAAREAKRGIWSRGARYQSPRDWRRRHR